MSGKFEKTETEAKVVNLGTVTPARGCEQLDGKQKKSLKKAIEKAYSEIKTTSCEADCLTIKGKSKKDADKKEKVSVKATLKGTKCTYTCTPEVRFITYVTKGTCVRKKIEGIEFAALVEPDEGLMDTVTVVMQDAQQQILSAVQGNAALQLPLSGNLNLVNEAEASSPSFDVNKEENVN